MWNFLVRLAPLILIIFKIKKQLNGAVRSLYWTTNRKLYHINADMNTSIQSIDYG